MSRKRDCRKGSQGCGRKRRISAFFREGRGYLTRRQDAAVLGDTGAASCFLGNGMDFESEVCYTGA